MKTEGEGEKIPIPFPLSLNPLPFSTPATPQAAQTHVTLFPCNESLGHPWLRKLASYTRCFHVLYFPYKLLVNS